MNEPAMSERRTPRCIPLAEIPEDLLGSVGGKAAGLVALTSIGLRVPPGFVIVGASAGRLPDDLEVALAALGDPVAVRSSAVGEDSADASFAGQFETYLDVRGTDAVRDAVERCMESVEGDRAVAYRESTRATGGVVMNVVIQRMVDARAAGVVFTVDPVSGRRDRVVVDVVAGLGESLVSGTATPDHYLTTVDGTIARRELASDVAVLDDATVLRIASEACDAAKRRGHPLDLEWAVDREGRLHWLQARPITHLPSDPRELDTSPRPGDVWTRANIGEMMPGAVTPLTISTSALAIDVGIQRLYRRAGIRPEPTGFESDFVANFGNHLFLNLSRMTDLSRHIFGAPPEHMGLAVVGRPVPELAGGTMAPFWKRVVTMARYLFLLVDIPRAHRRLEALVERYRPAKEVDPLAQWNAIDARFLELGRAYVEHLQSSASAGAMAPILLDIVRGGREATEADHARVAQLLSGAKDVDSADIATGIAPVVAELAALRDVDARFVAADDAAALVFLKSSTANAGFEDYLRKHGHRAVREAELRQMEWRADPIPVVRGLKAGVRAHRLGSVRSASSVGVDPSTLGLLMRRVVGLAHAAVRSREKTKSLVIELTARMKEAYRHLAALLADTGRLPDPDLVFFFTHAELGRFCRGDDVDGAARAVARRRALDVQAAYVFPEVFVGVPEPIEPSRSELGATGDLIGTPVSPGVVRGIARVARTIDEAADVRPGEILISPITDVGWTPYFQVIAGLATDVGSAVSHGAVVAREYGMPAVVNLRDATTRFRTGDRVILDGSRGTLGIDPRPATET